MSVFFLESFNNFFNGVGTETSANGEQGKTADSSAGL